MAGSVHPSSWESWLSTTADILVPVMDQEKIWFGLYSEQKCLQRCCPFTTQPTDQLCVCCSKVPFDVNSELALLYDLFGAEVATKLLNNQLKKVF